MPLMLNTVHVAGNLTRDPQVRFFANEKAVCDFGLAINKRFKDGSGNMKEETVFVDVSCWGRQAELCGQYLTKGRNCMIEGELKLDQWEDKSGGKRSKISITARRVHFLGENPNAASGAQNDHSRTGATRIYQSEENPYGADHGNSAAPSGGDDLDEPPF